MYYKISYDTNKENIGQCYPQTFGVKTPEVFNDPQFIDKIGFKRTNNLAVLPIPCLHKNAIKTDLVSSIARGTIGRLIVSEKLKNIFTSFNEYDMEFLEIKLLDSEQKELPYWLINPYVFQMSYIAYPESDIQVVTWGENFVRNLKLVDFQDFKNHEKRLTMPERLNISKVVIQKDVASDFFVLNSISGGGFCYFVSEKVKQAIEMQKCTGIVFDSIDVV